jgi:hypothetical protein
LTTAEAGQKLLQLMVDQVAVADLFTEFLSWHRLLEESVRNTEELFALSVKNLASPSIEELETMRKELAIQICQQQKERSQYLHRCSSIVKKIVEQDEQEIISTPTSLGKANFATDFQKDKHFELRAMQKLLQHFKNEFKKATSTTTASKLQRDIISIKEQIETIKSSITPVEHRRRTHDGSMQPKKTIKTIKDDTIRKIDFNEREALKLELDSELFESMIDNDENSSYDSQSHSPISSRDMIFAKTAPASPHHMFTPDRKAYVEPWSKISPIQPTDSPQPRRPLRYVQDIQQQAVKNMQERDRSHSAIVPNHYGLQNSIRLAIHTKK